MSNWAIFSEYGGELSQGLDDVNFCQKCGARLIEGYDHGSKRLMCPDCSYIHYKNPYPAVSVLIAKDRKVLLGKRDINNLGGDKWCMPCGYIEYDEDFVTAAKREVREETGLEVEIRDIINVAHNFLAPSVHSIVVVCYGICVGGSLAAGDDIMELGWFDIETLPEMAFQADVHIIKSYFSEKGYV